MSTGNQLSWHESIEDALAYDAGWMSKADYNVSLEGSPYEADTHRGANDLWDTLQYYLFH